MRWGGAGQPGTPLRGQVPGAGAGSRDAGSLTHGLRPGRYSLRRSRPCQPSCVRFPVAGPRCIPACSVSQARPGAPPGSRCARSGRPEIFSGRGRFLVPASPALFLCPLVNIFAARAARWPSRPIAPAFPLVPEHTTNQDPATGTSLRREHDMDAICSQCHGPAPDGPVFAEAGLLCCPAPMSASTPCGSCLTPPETLRSRPRDRTRAGTRPGRAGASRARRTEGTGPHETSTRQSSRPPASTRGRRPEYVIVTWVSAQLRDKLQRNGASLAEAPQAAGRNAPGLADPGLEDREAGQ